ILTLKTFDKLRIEVNQIAKNSFFIAYLESKQLKPPKREEHAKNAKNTTNTINPRQAHAESSTPETSTALGSTSPRVSNIATRSKLHLSSRTTLKPLKNPLQRKNKTLELFDLLG